MKILRAHSYDVVEQIRAELNRVPAHWLAAAESFQWIILPNDLKPSWIGLTLRSDAELAAVKSKSVDGRKWDDLGAWCADESTDYWVRNTPHIFTDHASAERAAIHEMMHALEYVWHVDVEAFFDPDAAWHDYMRTTSSEFWACALQAFLRPDNDDKHWNRLDVAQRMPDLHDFLQMKLQAIDT